MIYLDTSVALAYLLTEECRPQADIWSESLVSSRLLEYELWNRLHARNLADSHGDDARSLVGRTALVELVVPVLERALEPFPTPVRTLDSLHLATLDFLRKRGQRVLLASYDARMNAAAEALGFQLAVL